MESGKRVRRSPSVDMKDKIIQKSGVSRGGNCHLGFEGGEILDLLGS